MLYHYSNTIMRHLLLSLCTYRTKHAVSILFWSTLYLIFPFCAKASFSLLLILLVGDSSWHDTENPVSIITGSWLLLVVLWLSGSKSLKPNIIYSLRLSTNDGTPYKESPEVISSYFGNLVKTGLFQNRNPLSFGDCVYCIHPTKQQIDSSSVTILTTPQIIVSFRLLTFVSEPAYCWVWEQTDLISSISPTQQVILTGWQCC